MDILKKDITIDKTIGKETSQVLIEGDIIVPDIICRLVGYNRIKRWSLCLKICFISV